MSPISLHVITLYSPYKVCRLRVRQTTSTSLIPPASMGFACEFAWPTRGFPNYLQEHPAMSPHITPCHVT